MTFKEILENLTGGRPAWPDGTGGPGSCDFDIALVIRLIVSCLMFAAALFSGAYRRPGPR